MTKKTSTKTTQGTFAALINRFGDIEPILDQERFIVNNTDVDQHTVRWLKHKGVIFDAGTTYKKNENGKNRAYTIWEWKQDLRRELKEYHENKDLLDCGHRPHIHHHPEKDCLTCKFCAENNHYPEYTKGEIRELL